jgi:hypothetical protein
MRNHYVEMLRREREIERELERQRGDGRIENSDMDDVMMNNSAQIRILDINWRHEK